MDLVGLRDCVLINPFVSHGVYIRPFHFPLIFRATFFINKHFASHGVNTNMHIDCHFVLQSLLTSPVGRY